MAEFNFGEKTTERVKKQDGSWEDLAVFQTPKYIQTREKAIDLITSKKYDLKDSDFWILMNRAGNKMCYTGLIISHNGVLKINDKLEDNMKFSPDSVDVYKDEKVNIVLRYVNNEQGIYEFGEVSDKNCKNDYPYAMAIKRLQDRVILKLSKISFYGIYSESESDDFRRPSLEEKVETKTVEEPVKEPNVSEKDTRASLTDSQFDKLMQKSPAELLEAIPKYVEHFKMKIGQIEKLKERAGIKNEF